MLPTRSGAVRLFRFTGINVWLHWSWLVAAFWFMSRPRAEYSNQLWTAFEYLTLFAIVLLHEFGHALACRQVGGRADTIVLWPLGGVAYVDAPPRAGAQLWSIAAGPLVNVLLIPVFHFGGMFLIRSGAAPESYDFWVWLASVAMINQYLLIFNLLPVFPLDGGQILRSLLWFMIGPRKSLLVVTPLGLLAAIGLGLLGLMNGQIFLTIIAAFIGMNCWRAFQLARLGAG